MADPTNDEAARALERLASTQAGAPTPQPNPRAGAPTPRPATPRPAAPGAGRSAAPATSAKPARPQAPAAQDLQRSLAAAATSRAPSSPKPVAKPRASGNTFRRTLIPILLTSGFILIALATVHYAWRSIDNPVVDLSTPIVLCMFATGAVAWALAAANMLAVRRARR